MLLIFNDSTWHWVHLNNEFILPVSLLSTYFLIYSPSLHFSTFSSLLLFWIVLDFLEILYDWEQSVSFWSRQSSALFYLIKEMYIYLFRILAGAEILWNMSGRVDPVILNIFIVHLYDLVLHRITQFVIHIMHLGSEL